MVAFALEQVARQRDARLEVILALHGVPKGHPDVAAAINAFEGPLTVFEADHRAVFGEVLNDAAARASGSFLLKMDDDDWYGPDFLADLLLAHAYSGAQVVGTVPEFVYLSSIDVTVHRRQVTEQITSFVAGGRSWWSVLRSRRWAGSGRCGGRWTPSSRRRCRPRAGRSTVRTGSGTSCAAARPPTTPGRSRSGRSCSATGGSGAASARAP
ncbi:glycosyltransferase [Nonomuraea antimicrobica]